MTSINLNNYYTFYKINNQTNCKTLCKHYTCVKEFNVKNIFIYNIDFSLFEKYDLGNINSKYQPFIINNNFKIYKIEYYKDPCDESKMLIFVFFKFTKSKSRSYNNNINSGLTFNKKIFKNIDIVIRNFGKVPLYTQGFQFRYGNFTFPSKNNIPFIQKNTSLYKCFYQQQNFNENISNWNIKNVISLESTFQGCYNFNILLNNWNTNNVKNMKKCFYNCKNYNKNIENWDTSNVVNMESMFNNATSFNQYIGTWDTSNVVNMESMFNNATSFNQYILYWNVENVTTMKNMFKNALSYNEYIRNWTPNNLINADNMFQNDTLFLNSFSGTSTGYIDSTGTVTDITNYFNQYK